MNKVFRFVKNVFSSTNHRNEEERGITLSPDDEQREEQNINLSLNDKQREEQEIILDESPNLSSNVIYNWKNIEDFLTRSFTEKELHQLISNMSDPENPPTVYAGKSKRDLVRKLINRVKSENLGDQLIFNADQINHNKVKKVQETIFMTDNDIKPSSPVSQKNNTAQDRSKAQPVELEKGQESDKGRKKGTVKGLNVATTPKIIPSSEFIDSSGVQKYQRRKIRQEIVFEYTQLIGKETCDVDLLLDFVYSQKDNFDLIESVINEHRQNNQFPTCILRKILQTGNITNEDLLLKELIELRDCWIREKLPNPFDVFVDLDESGPMYSKISFDGFKKIVHELLGKASPEIQISGNVFINKSGEYPIYIHLSNNSHFEWKYRLVLHQDPIDEELSLAIKDLEPIITNEQKSFIEQMKNFMEPISPFSYPGYFEALGRVLITSYMLGYWKTPYVQEELKRWQDEKARIEERGIRTTTVLFKNIGNLVDDIEKVLLSDIQSNDKSLSGLSENVKDFQKSIRLVIEDVCNTDVSGILVDGISSEYSSLKKWLIGALAEIYESNNAEIKKELSERFIKQLIYLTKEFSAAGIIDSARFTLAHYCFIKGQNIVNDGKDKNARPYFLIIFHLFGLLTSEAHNDIEPFFYKALNLHLRTYDINLSFESNTAERFCNDLILNLLSLKNIESLGRCILEVSLANFNIINNEIIFRMEKQENGKQALLVITKSLMLLSIFIRDPFRSLRLIGRLKPEFIGIALINIQNDAKLRISDKKLVFSSFMKYLENAKLLPSVYLKTYIIQASNNMKLELAISILRERFVFSSNGEDKRHNEGQVKANLILEILGVQRGNVNAEYLLGRLKDLAERFNELDHDEDNPLSLQITEMIRIMNDSKIWFIRSGFTNNDMVTDLFESLNKHLIAEQAKLIRDTQLEVRLMTGKALFSETNTRLVIEVSNIGDGPAENLELLISEVEDEYEVDEHRKLINLGKLESKLDIIQKEIYIRPKVDPDSIINLSITLRYDTLSKKGKTASLTNNSLVYLYPLSGFELIPSRYNHSAPATTLFYGRQNLLDNMLARLKFGEGHDTSMIVYGIKRAGKTSILLKFYQHLLKEKDIDSWYIPIYADMLSVTNENPIKSDADFLLCIVRIIENGLPEDIKNKIQLKTDEYMELLNDDPYNVFKTLLFAVFNEIYPRRILLILDEFSEIGQEIEETKKSHVLSSKVFHYLSNIIQSNDQLSFIFTGTYILNEIMRKYALEMAKICYPVLVGSLEDDDIASRLVVEPLSKPKALTKEGGGLQYDPRAIKKLIDMTYRHPYLIQYIGSRIIDRMNNLGTEIVNICDIDFVLKDMVVNTIHVALRNTWEEFNGRPHQKILQVISLLCNEDKSEATIDDIYNKLSEVGMIITKGEVNDLCTALCEAQLLERSSNQLNAFNIKIPLLRLWIRHNMAFLDFS